MAGQGEDTIKDTDDQEGITRGAPLKRSPAKESIMESIDTTTDEMVTIATLKEALANYLLLNDIYDYEDDTNSHGNYLAYLLGRLEMSLIRRKQSLDEDRKALEEL